MQSKSENQYEQPPARPATVVNRVQVVHSFRAPHRPPKKEQDALNRSSRSFVRHWPRKKRSQTPKIPQPFFSYGDGTADKSGHCCRSVDEVMIPARNEGSEDPASMDYTTSSPERGRVDSDVTHPPLQSALKGGICVIINRRISLADHSIFDIHTKRWKS